MNKNLLILTIAVLSCLQVQAQTKTKSMFFKRTSLEAGITLASDGSQFSNALSINQYWGLGNGKRKFQVGVGARMTNSFGGNNAEYLTAPAKLTSGKTGPGVFFADQIEANLDTMTSESHNVNALNLYLALRYDFTQKWGAEFNIDLAGVSFGAHENLYFANPPAGSIKTKSGNGKPTGGNVLLISDNDIGTLNSEVMFFYKLNNRWKPKAGASFLFKEYTLGTPTRSASSTASVNDRFRNKSLSFAIGLNYNIK